MRTALIALGLLGACGATRAVEPGVLYCGAQPDAAALARAHAQYGVRTVVNLRGEQPGEAWFEEEQRGVAAIGARWVHLRTSGRVAPTAEHVDAFFDLVEEPEAWPLYVHCQSGIHRTGLMCALYRIQYQGWDNERAWREMVGNGFRLGTTDRDEVERFVKTFTPDPARQLPSTRAP